MVLASSTSRAVGNRRSVGTDAIKCRLRSAPDLQVQVIDHETRGGFLARDLNVFSAGRVMTAAIMLVMKAEIGWRWRARVGAGRRAITSQIHQSDPRAEH